MAKRSIKNPKRKKPASKAFRIKVIGSIVFLSFTSLILRAAYIQVSRGSEMRAAEVNTQFAKIPVMPQRGWIYDANGQVLAYDTPSVSLVLNRFTTIPDSEYHSMATKLAPVLNMSATKLYQTMIGSKGAIQVALTKDATDKQVAFVEENHSDFPDIDVEQTYRRVYPNGDLAGQVLGYVGSITQQNEAKYSKLGYMNMQTVGVSGLELQYEHRLQGTPGYQLITLNAAGRAVGTATSSVPPVGGENIQVALDGHLQAQSQMIIQNLIDKSSNKSLIPEASSVVVDVKTGGVLSMVSYPYLDPNWYTTGTEWMNHQNYLRTSGAQMNFAIQDQQAPGSTVKPANLLTAFKQGTISPGTVIDDLGRILIGKTPKNEDMGMVFGAVNPVRAIAISSDVFFYQVGLWMGKWFGSSPTSGGGYPSNDGSYQHYLNTDYVKGLNALFQGEWDFGLGPKTGIDLPGEVAGKFYNQDSTNAYVLYDLKQSEAQVRKTGSYPNNGTPAVLAMAGIGQSQAFTTIQLANYATALANNGKKLQPHLLQNVFNSTDTPTSGSKPVSTFQTKVTGQVSGSTQYYDLLKQAMHEVTTGSDSTAAGLFNGAGYQVAAKTGTAQIGINGHMTDNSVFICYAPLNNPQVAMAVMIPGGGYGASLAGVIAKQTLDAYFNEHHAPFMKKSGWTDTKIPGNWKSSPAYQIPEHSN